MLAFWGQKPLVNQFQNFADRYHAIQKTMSKPQNIKDSFLIHMESESFSSSFLPVIPDYKP